MMNITLDQKNLKGAVEAKDIQAIGAQIQKAHKDLENKTGKGSEFTGWLNLPSQTKDSDLKKLAALGKSLRESSDCLVSVGIGGSYLGIHSSVEYLVDDVKLPVYFAGQNMSAWYTNGLLKQLQKKNVALCVISKSGTTTEPALAFRILEGFLRKKYDAKECKKRIVCVTDANKGALLGIARKEGYQTFPIADDVGGRFSVLSYVGLVPLAIAGIDIQALIEGARDAEKACAQPDVAKNTAYQYAASRYLLYKQGKKIEILSTFYSRMSLIKEWWKQLAGESEGKEGKGIFPAACNFSADLHSMGQLIQEGERNIFETFLMAADSGSKIAVPVSKDNLDNFNCVAGKDLDFVNKQAHLATAAAHLEGGVPNMTITVPGFDAYSLGALYYFFEKSVAMTGYLMGVNPFDQPGVEAYKTKMFALLGRK